MPGNRNILYLVIGALIVAVGVLGYNLYQTKKQPEGLQINRRSQRTEDREQVRSGHADHEDLALQAYLLVAAAARCWRCLRARRIGRQIRFRASRTLSICGSDSAFKVDDGTCPAGQIKEVSGAKMTATGIVRARKCISRLGPKKR